MSDNLQNRGGQDRKRIDVHQDYELRDWAKKFGATPEQIKQAVQAVGTRADDVEMHLKGGRGTASSERPDSSGSDRKAHKADRTPRAKAVSGALERSRSLPRARRLLRVVNHLATISDKGLPLSTTCTVKRRSDVSPTTLNPAWGTSRAKTKSAPVGSATGSFPGGWIVAP